MDIEIKKMETEEETREKAYVHWCAWHEAYPGLVSQEYLNKLTLEKCEKIAFDWPDNLMIAKDAGRVIGFVGYDPATVLSVTPGSPAAEAGLQNGDIIKRMGGSGISIGREVDSYFLYNTLDESPV